MNTDVSRIINKTLKKEGGYVWDADDPGGETNLGLSRKSYPDLDLKNLTRDQAKEIYERDYYNKLGFDGTERIDYRWKLHDICVHCGVSVALKFKKTVSALYPDFDTMLNELADLQANRYRWLATRNPVLQKFLKGWLRRASDLGADLL